MELKTSRGIIEYRLIKSRRKTMCVEIDADAKVTVRVPLRVNEKDVMLFLESKSDWIIRKCEEQKKVAGITKEYRHTFKEGDVFFFLGEKYELRFTEFTEEKKVETDDTQEIMFVNASVTDVEKTICEWYLENMKIILSDKIRYYANTMGVRVGRITLRDQKTRWGSCSSLGNLNFNWRLIMAPKEVIDYVVVHEMCHLKQMNHSKLFWNEVKKYCPDYSIYRKWLKDNGKYLVWI